MKNVLLLLVLGIMLSACEKNDEPIDTVSGDGKYLKKVNYWTPASNKEVTIRELVVDGNGNLSGVRTYTNNLQGGTSGQLIWEFTGIEKDVSGKIIKVSGLDKMQNKALVYEFTYDANGNITKTKLLQDGAENRAWNYTYDSSNRLVYEEELASNNSNKQVSVTNYTYTGASLNPSAYKQEAKLYGQVYNYTLKFDDKKNPAQAAPKVLFAMGLGDFYTNNVTEINDGTTVTKYTLTYNSAGYATSTTAGNGSGLKFVYGD